jgi:pyruvyltransferase
MWCRWWWRWWWRVRPSSVIKSRIPRCKTMQNSTRLTLSPTRMWWWAKENNFGDWIGAWLAKKITGKAPAGPIHATVAHPSIYSVGSIISQLMPGAIVWGSGIIKFECRPKRGTPSVRSVRGPLTRRRLQQCRIKCPERYGDPGMIMPRYAPAPGGPKKYKLGIIPHYVDYKAMLAHPIAKDPRILIIDLKTINVDKVLRELWQCERTVSSSLHGVIISVAYGIPTRWFMVGNKIFGNHVKYFDFFLSLKAKETHPDLMKQSIAAIKHHQAHKRWPPATKFPAIKDWLPLDYRHNPKDITFDGLFGATVKYPVTPSLVEDIMTSCPL